MLKIFRRLGKTFAWLLINLFLFSSLLQAGSIWTFSTYQDNLPNQKTRDWYCIASSSDGTKLIAGYNNGTLFASSDSGSTWKNCYTAGVQNWESVAMSGDGSVIYAASSGSGVFKSTDFGDNWVQVRSGGTAAVATSADGTKVIIGIGVGSSGYLYYSTNGGGSWTPYSGAGNKFWTAVCISADGSLIAGAASGDYIYVSTNDGSTWTQRGTAKAWKSLTTWNDGSNKLAAAAQSGEYIYISNDLGVTWNKYNSPSGNWLSLSSSQQGEVLVAVDSGINTWRSFDKGQNWTSFSPSVIARKAAISADGKKITAGGSSINIIRLTTEDFSTWTRTSITNVGGRDWQGIAAAKSGSGKLIAIENNGYIYVSTNSGASWQSRMTDANRAWKLVAISKDGTRMAAVINGGLIYTSNNSGDTWTSTGSTGSWSSIKFSPDGTRLYATTSSSSGQVYTATTGDNGATWTWTACTGAGSRDWTSIATGGANGTNVAASAAGGVLAYSTNNGSTWSVITNATGGYGAQAISSSEDGYYYTAVTFTGRIYTSSDRGATWTARESSRYWWSVDCSLDGTKVVAYAYTSSTVDIYRSTDNGSTWGLLKSYSGTNIAAGFIASSGDGNNISLCNAQMGITNGTYFTDNTAPNFNADVLMPSSWTNGSVQLTVSATDPELSAVSIKQTDITGATGAYSLGNSMQVTIASNGTYYFRAKDSFNNESSVHQVNITNIDKTVPSIPQSGSITYLKKNSIQPNQINFVGSTDAQSGVENYQYYWGTEISGTGSNSISGTSYTPELLAEGKYAKFYLRVRAKDYAGNYSDWKTVFVYDYNNNDDYTFYNQVNTSINIAEAEPVRYERKIAGEPIGHVSINIPELGMNFYSNIISNVIIDRDITGHPFVSVPAGSDLATAVNGQNKWVPIKLGPFTKAPIIKYSADGNTWQAIVDYDGEPISTNIRNYSFANNYVTFEVNHFSTYGTAVLDSVQFTADQLLATELQADQVITVNVKDNNGEGIENAPVTFSIQSGLGLLAGSAGDKLVRTNAAGVATINYTFPNQYGLNIVKADVDGVFDTISLKIPGGLTAAELAAYNAWASGYSGLGAQNDDPDGDGVINILEWNWGVDSTNPLLADTDSDGLNDKWDAYPKNGGQKVFKNGLNPDVATGETFSGTGKGIIILAPSSNLVLGTEIDINYQKNATADALSDDAKNVIEINGLAKESVRDGNLAFASTMYANDYYKGLKPGEAYSVLLSYINRGNDTDAYGVTVDLVQQSNRWTTSYSNSGLNNVGAWQIAQVEVKAMPESALSFEKTTLNITVGYDAGTAVSYNAYTGAFINNTYANEGYYGGEDNFSYTFRLEAEGYDLKVLSRSTTINAPSSKGYTGNGNDLVPGTKVKYIIAIYNNSTAVATSVNLKDAVPNNCHFYYSDAPAVVGALGWDWKGATDNNAGPGVVDPINFEITIPARGTVTASYTVTVD